MMMIGMMTIVMVMVMMMLPSECQTNKPDGEEQSLEDVSCHKGFTYAHFHNKPLLSLVASELICKKRLSNICFMHQEYICKKGNW